MEYNLKEKGFTAQVDKFNNKTSIFKILNNIGEYELYSGRSLTNSEKVAIITEAFKKEIGSTRRGRRDGK